MNLDRFKQLLETYGADFDCWPVAERDAGQKMAADHPGVLEEARALDALLQSVSVPTEAPEGLAHRIVSAAMAEERVVDDPAQGWLQKFFGEYLNGGWGFQMRPAYIFAPGGGLAAALVLGFFMGVSQGLPGTGDDLLLDPVFYQQSQVLSEIETWPYSEEVY